MQSALQSVASIAEHLRFRAERSPHADAFRWLYGDDRIETITWSELHARAVAIAIAARDRAPQGSHVILCIPQGLEFIAAIFGCFYAGFTAVPVYPPLSAKNIPRFMQIHDDSEAALVLTTRAVARKLELLSAPRTLRLFSLDDIERCAGHADTDMPSSDQLALLQYTSGTVSAPKGVMITHGNLLANETAMSRAYCLGDEPHFVSWLPFYHDMGLMGGIFLPVFCGATATLLSPASFLRHPAIWLRAISDTRATIAGSPNFGFDLCAARVSDEVVDALDFSNWRTAVCGAEMIRRETIDKFTARFARAGFRASNFIASYGLAEATLYVTCGDYQGPRFAAPNGGTTQFANCGAPQMGCVVVVDTHTCRRVADGTIGEIWIKTPSVGRGYWRQEHLSQQSFNATLADIGEGGFLRSGDLGFMKDGDLFVTGRIKELVILRGKNYAPQDIEMIALGANAAFSTLQCAAFSVDGEASERLIVVQEVSRRLESAQSPAHLRADILLALRGALSVEADDIVLVKQNSLPRTSSGKLQRAHIKTLYQKGELDYLTTESETEAV